MKIYENFDITDTEIENFKIFATNILNKNTEFNDINIHKTNFRESRISIEYNFVDKDVVTEIENFLTLLELKGQKWEFHSFFDNVRTDIIIKNKNMIIFSQSVKYNL